MKRYGLTFFFLFLVSMLFAQEFRCKVEINTEQIQGFDQSVITSLKTAMTEFINNRKWTHYNFKPEERIECTLLFNINKVVSDDEFKGSFHLVLERPVFNSSYYSPLLNMIDKEVQFRYTPSQSMNYVENAYSDNLTSLLAFYAYMMLGIDFDTFSKDGGSPYYQLAMNVVQSAQNSTRPGWKAFEGQKNRYHFVEQFLNKAYEPLRLFLYQYHRLGLDMMAENVDKGRLAILASLSNLEQVYNKRPGLYDLQLILDAKSNEIIKIFSKAPIAEKNRMVNILSVIDPSNGSRYRKVLRNH